MKTEFYNPSKLEIDLAKAITALKPQLAAQLPDMEILHIQPFFSSDNPYLLLKMQDADGDGHEVVLQLIQRPDSLVK